MSEGEGEGVYVYVYVCDCLKREGFLYVIIEEASSYSVVSFLSRFFWVYFTNYVHKYYEVTAATIHYIVYMTIYLCRAV